MVNFTIPEEITGKTQHFGQAASAMFHEPLKK